MGAQAGTPALPGANHQALIIMESEIALTSIFILVLVVTATAKSALDELSDVGLRLLASEGNGSGHTEFWRSIVVYYQ